MPHVPTAGEPSASPCRTREARRYYSRSGTVSRRDPGRRYCPVASVGAPRTAMSLPPLITADRSPSKQRSPRSRPPAVASHRQRLRRRHSDTHVDVARARRTAQRGQARYWVRHTGQSADRNCTKGPGSLLDPVWAAANPKVEPGPFSSSRAGVNLGARQIPCSLLGPQILTAPPAKQSGLTNVDPVVVGEDIISELRQVYLAPRWIAGGFRTIQINEPKFL